MRAHRLSFTTSLAEGVEDAAAVFIAVGTPSRPADGLADLTYVYQAARELAGVMRGHAVIVNKSTVPVGTGDEIARIIADIQPDADLSVVSNPEFLREGAAIADFMAPDRIVIGTDDERAREVMYEILSPARRQADADAVHPAARSGAHQVRGQRVPGDQDHLHQRDR